MFNRGKLSKKFGFDADSTKSRRNPSVLQAGSQTSEHTEASSKPHDSSENERDNPTRLSSRRTVERVGVSTSAATFQPFSNLYSALFLSRCHQLRECGRDTSKGQNSTKDVSEGAKRRGGQ